MRIVRYYNVFERNFCPSLSILIKFSGHSHLSMHNEASMNPNQDPEYSTVASWLKARSSPLPASVNDRPLMAAEHPSEGSPRKLVGVAGKRSRVRVLQVGTAVPEPTVV